MFNLGKFTTLVYLSPNILRAQGKLRNLTNIKDGLFSTEPCITLVHSELKAYSRLCEISMIKTFIHNLRGQSRIQGIFRILPNIYHEIFYSKPCEPWHIEKTSIFRTLVYSEIKAYSEPCRTSKILLRTLCNYSRFRGFKRFYLEVFKTFAYSEPVSVSCSLMHQLSFRTTNILLYALIKMWATL